MNWPLAIARNRTALLAVVAAIVALVGGREGGVVARGVRKAALALLRPAEPAARRLIVIVARGLVVPSRPAAPGLFAALRARRGAAAADASGPAVARVPAFRLVDPAKRHVLRLPRPPAPRPPPLPPFPSRLPGVCLGAGRPIRLAFTG